MTMINKIDELNHSYFDVAESDISDTSFVNKIDLSGLETLASARSMDSDLKDCYKMLITRFLRIHGTGKLQCYKNGFELSIPSPEMLVENGPRELSSKHLYVNLTLYIEKGLERATHCVRSDKVYSIPELLAMEPLEKRDLPFDIKPHLQALKNHTLTYSIMTEDLLDYDEESGDAVCLPPGICVPIIHLPEDHVAVQYLKSRGFEDLQSLYDQFLLSFCQKENPQFKHIFKKPDGSPYTYNPYGSTPQGKLIFFIRQFKSPKGWQARNIEFTLGGTDKYVYIRHDWEDESKNGIELVAKLNPETNKFEGINPQFNKLVKRKYTISPGLKSSDCLLGFDAALKFNVDNMSNLKDGKKVIGLVEGALDAGRLGAPFCSVMGNRVSTGQLKLVVNNFDKVIVIKDHDNAGETLCNSIRQKLAYLNSIVDYEEISYPAKYKDVGEITDKTIIDSIRSNLFN